MKSQQNGEMALDISSTLFNPKSAITWIEHQETQSQLLQTENVFQELLHNAAKPKHFSSNTCSKLCGFVEQCSKSDSPILRGFAFSEDTAIKLFDFYVEWNEQDSHRSMKLVLDFLAYSISHNPVTEHGTAIRTRILRDTVTMITRESSRPSVKSATACLDYIIQKDIVYLSDVLQTYRHVHGLPADTDDTWDGLILKLFSWMELHYVCSVAGKLLVTIFTNPWYKGRNARFYPESWHKFVYRALQTNLELLEPVKLYVFIPLFKIDKAESLNYLQNLSSLQSLTGEKSADWDLNSILWLAMLEAGKKAGFVDEPGTGLKPKPGAVAQLSPQTLEAVLCHRSIEARSAAVSILITSPSTTRPYSGEVFELLKKHLPSFYADADPKFRYDVLGHSRYMVKRIQGALELLRRDYERVTKKLDKTGSKAGNSDQASQPEGAVKELQDVLDRHQRFVCWYMNFLKDELVPTASYQRHITALKAMNFVLKSTLPEDIKNIQGQDCGSSFTDFWWLRSVLDLILDPFDDVREAAASLIMLLAKDHCTSTANPIQGLQRPVVEELRDFCRRAEELARKTARADHSDGVARSYEILWRWTAEGKDQLRIVETIISDLEQKLVAAESDLASAVLQAPVHGSFAAIRYLWGSLSSGKYTEDDLNLLEDFQDRAITCCDRIWRCVQHVLCDDSPEGHLPEELEEVEGLDTKDLLSYSFRAIHESSNLLRTIGNNARNDRGRGLLSLPRMSFEKIGRLTFDELSKLRHRGAFTTVTQTFSGCCQLVKYFPATGENGPTLLDEWYKGALDCIYTQASTTRRSAGIPSLIVGILSSNADRPSFDTVMRELREISERPALISETDGSNLPQVHALNCLKDIFKSSAFSKRVDVYLTDTLQLAADSLKSEVWAIRNCGLLLLRSLIDSLFGTNESKASMEAGWDGRTTRISYAKYPALPAVLANLLETGRQSPEAEEGVLIGARTTAESVFPALDIVRRAGPPEAARDRLYGAIAWYLGSRIWHVRELAARTLCSFLLRPGWTARVGDLIAGSRGDANRLHGALLTLKFLLERLREVMPDLLFEAYPDELRSLIEAVPDMNGSLATCDEARAVYVEIISFVTQLGPVGGDGDNPRFPISIVAPPPAASSALLRTSLAVSTTRDLLRRSRIDDLGRALRDALDQDIDVACAMLETLSRADTQTTDPDPGPPCALARMYIDVCTATEAARPRTLALECLADVLDGLLKRGTSAVRVPLLPDRQALAEFWNSLQRGALSPGLSDAVVRLSGSLLAVLCVSGGGGDAPESELELEDGDLCRWLRAWGVMISDAGRDDRTFDTRMAAATGLQSFTTALFGGGSSSPQPATHHLPWLLALYDALNDDDDEVRERAAAAAAPVLGGQQLAAMEAARRLLGWLRQGASASGAFRAHAAGRMVGHVPSADVEAETEEAGASWTSAEAQLREALRFDDALFVVEDQNLFVDEVREVLRWRDVLFPPPPPSSIQPTTSPTTSTTPSPTETPELHALASWTQDGLRALRHLVESGDVDADADADDGPLGWASKPKVFAICARVLVCAAALSSSSIPEAVQIREALAAFRDVGRAARVHGGLLRLCGC